MYAQKILIFFCFMFALNAFSQTADSIDWTGKYIFDKKKAGQTYTYTARIDKVNSYYVAEVDIIGVHAKERMLAYAKTDSNIIHLFFSSYKDSGSSYFRYGDMILSIERKSGNELLALVYGFDPLPDNKANLTEQEKTETPVSKIVFSGHVETYYAWDTDKDKSLRQFTSTSAYRDMFRIGIAQLSGSYSSERFRGIVTFHYGDIVNVNWPQLNALQYIQEANLGFMAGKNFWVDAGLFLTHVGTESIFPRYNFFNTLALATYYEPIYQTGVKLSYSSGKFYGCFHLLNGYNQLTDNNKNKSIGLQLGYKPNDKLEFTYNNIFGNEQPSENNSKVRLYNNLVIKFFPSGKTDLLVGIDHCYQQDSHTDDSTSGANLVSGLIAMRYRFSEKFSLAGRFEYHNDESGILSGTFLNSDSTLSGLEALGFTLGMEFKPVDFGYVRLEGRYLKAKETQKIFYDNSNTRFEIILSAGASF